MVLKISALSECRTGLVVQFSTFAEPWTEPRSSSEKFRFKLWFRTELQHPYDRWMIELGAVNTVGAGLFWSQSDSSADSVSETFAKYLILLIFVIVVFALTLFLALASVAEALAWSQLRVGAELG